MKACPLLIIGAGLCSIRLLGADDAAQWSVSGRGPNFRVWEMKTLSDTEFGTRTNISSYREIATGLHYWNGSWQESQDQIDAVIDGAAATHGQHTCHWNANLNSVGAVTLTLPNGEIMRSHVIGLALSDGAQSVWIAQIQNSIGVLLPPKEILYPAALGPVADVRYTYTRLGIEQDIILRTQFPASPADYGMDPDTAVLQVWTEFIDAPEPVKSERTLPNGLVDQTLKFAGGAMRMGRGAAFILGGANERVANSRVAKSWAKTGDNRTFLVEQIPYRSIAADLATLPPAQAGAVKPEKVSRLAFLNSAPRPVGAKTVQPMRTAANLDFDHRKGLVIDYVLVNVDTNLVCTGDQTFFISGTVNVGTLELHGGTVLKFDQETEMAVMDLMVVNTRPHRMAVLTVKDDDTIGERIDGSTGDPAATGNYWNTMLNLQSTSVDLHDLRFSYAWKAVLLNIEESAVITDCQFKKCNQAITAGSTANTVDNCLFYDIGTAFLGTAATFHARHGTFDVCNTLTSGGTNNVLNLTNSILAAVTNLGDFRTNFGFVSRESSATGVFQTVGAGAHYLTDGDSNTNRNSGTTNIPVSLLANLMRRTTFPPKVVTNTLISSSTNLQIMAPRCTNAPDRGYHYAPLDYVYGSNVLSNATVTLPPGVALGTFTPGSNTFGLFMVNGAKMVGDGQPLNLARITRYNLVQEQANTAWIATNAGASIRSVTNTTLTLQWTESSAPAAAAQFSLDGSNRIDFAFRNCELGGGKFSSYRQQCSFTNCLIEGVTSYFEDPYFSVTNCWFNNTFFYGKATFNNATRQWDVFNNAFYNTADLGSDSGLNHGWNAYLPGQPLVSGWSSNSVITNFSFAAGPLGNYYLGDSFLVNRGTNSATNFGLYHFTTSVDQTKETNSTVDIGFHAIALNSDGSYIDTDDDGLPDWFEDKNGNGTVETNAPNNETNWQNWSTAGDDLSDNYFSIYFEYQNRTKDSQNNSEPQGTVIRGKGFRVYGTWTSGPYGSVSFLFEQMYRGLNLNVFTTTDDSLAANESWVTEYQLPSTNVNLKYLIKYDFNTFRLVVSNSTASILDRRIWRDNMMDALGPDGPGSITNAAYLIQGAKYTPAPFPPKRRYIWEGAVGNTSHAVSGPTVHAAFWPIKFMVSRGSNVFYSCGYNEGGLDVARFSTNNPQVVNTNFSRDGRAQNGSIFVTDMAYKDANTLYVKYNNGNVVSFNVNTCAKIAENLTDFPSPPSNNNVPTANGVLAVHPGDSSIVAVYYTNTEQVVAYTNANSSTGWGTNFVIGVINGYSNGPSILVPTNTDSFRTNLKLSAYYYESPGNKVFTGVLCFQSDGKLWAGDTMTSRMLRFDTNGRCDAWFMYNPHSYCAFSDPNDPTRVFDRFSEFRVDYSKPLQSGWVLTNFWGRLSSAGHGEIEHDGMTEQGIYYPVTLTNGTDVRTYALVWDPGSGGNPKRLVELTTNGVRATAITGLSAYAQLERDGSLLSITTNALVATFNRSYISAWSGADPVYSSETLGTVSYTPSTDPIHYNYKRAGNTAVTFFEEKNLGANIFTGFHLGAVTNIGGGGSGSWIWKTSPTGPLNGRGNFDTNATYPGSTHTIIGTNIFFVYRGEYWNGNGQGTQIFHYSTNGTFIGQCGLPKPGGIWSPNLPGAAGNVFNFSAVSANGVIYLYTSDEGNHGVHRWRIE
jgi:hypothetical protein